MLVKATVSFAGAVTMARAETRDIPSGAVLDDLLRAGYVVSAEVQSEKAVKADDSKRGKSKSG